MPRFLTCLLLLLLPTLAVAQSPPRPAKLGLCVSCHGDDGRSRARATPHLGGQDEAYLGNALRAYRNGQRRAQPMASLANTLQPADIAALARWYASQPGFGRP